MKDEFFQTGARITVHVGVVVTLADETAQRIAFVIVYILKSG